MRNEAVRLSSIAMLGLAMGGCGVAGTWKTVSVDPQTSEGAYPISTITFDDNNMTYSASKNVGGKLVTSTGKYDWNGMKLTIMPEGKPVRSYSGSRWLDTLWLSHTDNGQKTTATLKRQPLPQE